MPDFTAPNEPIIVLESYYEPIAAHLARTRLEAAGIPCFLSNENLISLNRLYSPVAGGVRLHVRRSDAAAAAAILREELAPMSIAEDDDASTTADGPTARCPRCNSANVAYGPATRNTYNFGQMLLSLLLRYPFRGRCYHCFHCGHEFR